MEPDQIDMMDETELRVELRKVIDENISLKKTLEVGKSGSVGGSVADYNSDIDKVFELTKELLKGADLCSREPYFIVQPFLGIVKRHMEIIKKYDLM